MESLQRCFSRMVPKALPAGAWTDVASQLELNDTTGVQLLTAGHLKIL